MMLSVQNWIVTKNEAGKEDQEQEISNHFGTDMGKEKVGEPTKILIINVEE